MYKAALESLHTLIKAATTSMTSVPKPLKFLRPHYETLKTIYEKIKDPVTKVSGTAQPSQKPISVEVLNGVTVKSCYKDLKQSMFATTDVTLMYGFGCFLWLVI